MHNHFHPSEADLHWIEKTIGDTLELYYYHYDLDNTTESNTVRRLSCGDLLRSVMVKASFML